ncbi:MAG: tetratricopeptide repeat protein [Ancalomicrobiaceae bacterium]|nr:tetratricopeptide repeat protein [Ancalomicrobiaceae bacterium]
MARLNADPVFTLSRLLLAGTVVAGLTLGACARSPSGTSGDPSLNASVSQATPGSTLATMEAWAARYKSAPNRDNAIAYAQALRANDQSAQAVAVLQEQMLKNPKDTAIASAYGKALASNGDFDQALKVVRAANSPTNPDWRLLSAEGAILDQLGDSAGARGAYSTALKIAPEEPTLLNNLALSYLLTNNLQQADALLRRAVASPRADSRIRQNLALVLGLEGKFAEADQVARQEMSPDQAAANLAYLKSMLSQQNTWRQIKQVDKPKTNG